MKRPLLLLSLTGLACGTAAAWLSLPPPSGTPDATGRSTMVSPAGDGASGTGAVRSLTESWRHLRACGASGWHQRLALFTLAEAVPASLIRRLLDQTPLHDVFARELLLRRWLALDPPAAGAWAAQVLNDMSLDLKPTDSEAKLVFSFLAAKDPVGTLMLIHRSANASAAVPFSYEILGMLLETDMAAGIALGAACRSPDSVLNWSFSRNSKTWINKDPARAAALLSALPPGGFRDHNLCAAVAALAEKDFAAALALQRKFPGLQPARNSSDSRLAFYQQWAKKDLDGFTEYVNQEATGEARLTMKRALATALGEKDPLTALPWIAENLGGWHRTKAMEKVLMQLTQSDPSAARNYLAGLSDGSVLGTAVEAFLGALPLKDHTSLFEQAAALPDGPARVRVTGKAYQDWFRADPDTALRGLANVPPQTLPDDLWHNLGQQSATPADGIKQLNALPAGAGADFVRGLWQRHVVQAAPAEWSSQLEALTDPNLRSAALGVLPNGRKFAQLVEWAKTLPNPAERQQVAAGLSEILHYYPAKEREILLAPLR